MSMATIVSCVLQVTLFAASAGVVYLVVRRLHASLGATTAALSLAVVLVLTALAASPWPRWEFARTTAKTQAAVGAVPTSEVKMTDGGEGTRATGITAEPLALDSPFAAAWNAFAEAITEPPRESTPMAAPVSGFSWRTVVRWLIMGCLAVGLARFVGGIWVVRRLVRESRALVSDDRAATELLDVLQAKLSVTRCVALRESTTIATPATVGWRRPTILLPATWRDWSPEELEAVLAHELAHIAARDYCSWLVARLAVAVHFYHPLVHWFARRLQLEQELAADAMAAQVIGDRQSYLRSLASLALATPHHRLMGPAQTLIPGRSLLMRRVEMLRESRRSTSTATSRPAARLATVFAVALLAIGVAGVRQVASGQDAPATAVVASPAEKFEKVPRIGLEVVPEGAAVMLAVRPAEILRQSGFRELTAKIDELLPADLKEQNLSIDQIAEVVIFPLVWSSEPTRVVVRFVDPTVCTKVVARSEQRMKKNPGYAKPEPNVWQYSTERITKMDERTIVLDRLPAQRAERSFPPVVQTGRGWTDEWERAAGKQVVVAFDVERFLNQLAPADRDKLVVGGLPMQFIAPAIKGTKWCVASADLIENLQVSAVAQCKDAASAKSVAATSQAAAILLGNVVEQQRALFKQQLPLGIADTDSMIDAVFDLAAEFSSNVSIVAEGDQVKLTYHNPMADTQKVAIATGLLLPAIESARATARITQSMNNLRQILLAMHLYNDEHSNFPPAVTYEELPNGTKIGRSWRVEILPYLGEEELYKQYKQLEPWDSDANKAVLAKMPAVFRSPSDEAESKNTAYFALTGQSTMFHNNQGCILHNVTDGTANTIAVVDAKRDIPWTKPEDIAYDPSKPLPKLGGQHWGGFLVGFADGHVEAMSEDIDEQTLRLLIEKADGKAIPGR